ncbi:MAG: hypothetical protein AAB584_01935 [Patescibacteria group bacterium]
MKECDHDFRTGESTTLALSGKEYDLKLQGEKWTGQRRRGSEYTESNPSHYWFEGIGIAEHRPTGRITHFIFQTWLAEEGRDNGQDRELEDFVLISDRWYTTRSHWGREKKLPLVESRRADLTDHICKKIFEDIGLSKKLVPKVSFGMFSNDWLTINGFVFDEIGQTNLPNLNPSPT